MFLLFDIGGTSIRLYLTSSRDKKVDINKVIKIPTPKKFEDGIMVFEDFLKQNKAENKIEASIGGITGVLNKKRDKLIRSLNLNSWTEEPIKQKLEEITKSKVILENDSALATLGEATFGKGKDYPIVSYITISTGFGGSRVVNKKIDRSSFNFEPGHQIININNSEKYYLEDIVSGSGILKRTGIRAEDIYDDDFWSEVEEYVSIGINNLIVHWSPDVVVIGGGIGKKLDLTKIRENVKRINRIYPILPDIEVSNLRHNGIHGAFYLLKERT